MTEQSFVCATCGQEHDGLPTDWGFKMPDDIFSLSWKDKYRRARIHSDLCALDEQRYFIRGLLSVPFSHQPGDFSWGVWVEVSKSVHDYYFVHYDDDISGSGREFGTIANAIPAYDDLPIGSPVQIQWGSRTSRPSFILDDLSSTAARHQRSGIDADGHHLYLERIGYFEPDV